MGLQIAALAIFVGVFILATLRKVHIGVLMFAAAAAVGVGIAGMNIDRVVAGFPIGILVLLVGVTYFFSIAQTNGTVDRIIELAISKVGDRAFFLPLAFFALTVGISAMGSPLAGLVMAPMGMPLAKRYNIDRMLIGLAFGSGLSA
jgi:di/tricarboxylate transporter